VDKNKRVYGGAAPLRGRVWPRAYGRHALGAWLRGQSNPPVKGLCRFASTYLPLLPLFQEKNEVLACQRDPLVLQLDTFGETIGRIPVLRGPRLHSL